jgi:hypothetical protein
MPNKIKGFSPLWFSSLFPISIIEMGRSRRALEGEELGYYLQLVAHPDTARPGSGL